MKKTTKKTKPYKVPSSTKPSPEKYAQQNNIKPETIKELRKILQLKALHDKTGQLISVGDYIIYGHALGRCAGLKFGKILNIKIGTGRVNYGRPEGTIISVIGVEDDFYFPNDSTPYKKGLELSSRVGRLQFPNRIIVLDPKILQPEYKTLLDSYQEKTQK